MRITITVLILVLAACGKDAVSPPPPAIVQLLVADSAPGFWRGDSLNLASLVIGAVNSAGDTVPAPAVTWTVPSGFVRSGTMLRAIREARGTLQALSGTVSADLITTAVSDLSERTWQMEHRCYNSAVVQRGVESPPIGQDSMIRQQFNGVLTYENGDWKDLRATIQADRRVIRFWKDGVIDTVLGTSNVLMIQDTAKAAVYVQNVENLKMISDTPRVYIATWDPAHTTWCESSYTGGGSDFTLREP
jgi:hypothetical protein